MRTTKFRGQHGWKWKYGHYFVNVDGDHIIVADAFYEVSAETVGQFTGLRDKNGKEIYEGDIIRFVKGQKKDESGNWVDNAEVYAVEYSGAAFSPLCILSEVTDFVEIIGNIHENKSTKVSQVMTHLHNLCIK